MPGNIGLAYHINVTVDNLNELRSLYTQLQEIKTLMNSESVLRIGVDARSLAGLKEQVSSAVSSGAAIGVSPQAIPTDAKRKRAKAQAQVENEINEMASQEAAPARKARARAEAMEYGELLKREYQAAEASGKKFKPTNSYLQSLRQAMIRKQEADYRADKRRETDELRSAQRLSEAKERMLQREEITRRTRRERELRETEELNRRYESISNRYTSAGPSKASAAGATYQQTVSGLSSAASSLSRIDQKLERLRFQAESERNLSGKTSKRTISEIEKSFIQRDAYEAQYASMLDQAATHRPRTFGTMREQIDEYNTLSDRTRRVRDYASKMQAESDALAEARRILRDKKSSPFEREQASARRAEILGNAPGYAEEGQALGIGGLRKDRISANPANKAYKELNAELGKTRKNLMEVGNAHLDAAKKETMHSTALTQFLGKLKSQAFYMVASGLVFGAAGALFRGVSHAGQFEQAMAEIQGVFVSKSPLQRELVRQGVVQSSYDFGTSRADAASMAKIFAQTGANPEQTVALTRAALLGSRGAGLDADQSAQLIIAAQNITHGRVSPGGLMDRISRIEARYPITAPDLATGIQRVGALATDFQPSLVGTTDAFDTIMGAMTQIVTQTRVTGNQAATSLRFMLSRLSFPEVQNTLQTKYGIELGESKDRLKSLPFLLQSVADKYHEYESKGETVKAMGLLTTFGGARQAAQAAALFDNFGKAMDIAKESSLAFGDAQRRLSIMMDTLPTKVERLGTAFDNAVSSFLEATGLMAGIKGTLSFTASALQFGATHPTLSAAGGAVGGTVGAALLRKVPGALAKLGKAGLVSEGAAGIGTMLSGGLEVAAIAATVLAVLALLFKGGKLVAQAFGWIDSDKEHERKELYGAAKFDRSTYDASSQGKAFKELASKYSMSPEVFYGVVGSAYGEAEAKTAAQFPQGGALFKGTATNRKAYNAFMQNMIGSLSTALPGFVKLPYKEQLQRAEDLLQPMMMYGGVGFSVQQADLVEKGTGELQRMQAALLAGNKFSPDEMVEAAKAAASRTQSDIIEGRRPTLERPSDRMKALASLGFAYSRQSGQIFGHTKMGQQYRDIQNVLRSFSGTNQLGIHLDEVLQGMPTKDGTGNALRAVNMEIYTSIGTLGDALDHLANTVLSTKDGFEDFVASIKKQQIITFDMASRMKEGLTATGVSTISGSGGRFIEMYIKAYTQALDENVKELTAASATGDSRAARILKSLESAQSFASNEKNRESMMAVINENTKGMGRPYLRDRLLRPFLEYGKALSTSDAMADMFPGTGLGSDPMKERATATIELVKSLAGIRGQLGADVVNAANRVYMADQQAKGLLKGLPGMEDLNLEPSDTASATLYRALAVVKSELQNFKDGNNDLFVAFDKETGGELESLLHITAADFAKMVTLSPGHNPLYNVVQTLSGLNILPYQERERGAYQRQINYQNRLSALSLSGQRAIGQTGMSAALQAALGNPLAAQSLSATGIYQQQGLAVAQARLALKSELDKAAADNISDPFARGQAEAVAKAAYTRTVNEAYDSAITKLAELMNTASAKYADMRFQQAERLFQSATQGIGAFLLNPTQRGGLAAMLGPVGSTGMQQVLAAASSNVFSLYRNKIINPANASIFQTADMLQQAALADTTLVPAQVTQAGLLAAGMPGMASGLLPLITKQRTQKLTDSQKKALQAQLMALAGNLGGSLLGSSTGVQYNGAPNNYAGEGASIGTMIGSFILPGVGSLVGGLLGGFIGGRFGKSHPQVTPEFAALQKIEQNTRDTIQAINNQTQLIQFNNSMMYVPSTFNVPQARPFGYAGAGGVTINVHGAGQPEEVAHLVMKSLHNELQKYGTFSTPRF